MTLTSQPIDKGKHGVTAKEENINQCQFGVEYKIQVSSMANLGVNFNALQGSNGKAYDECKIWDDTAVIRIIYVEGTCFINNIYIVDEDGIIKVVVTEAASALLSFSFSSYLHTHYHCRRCLHHTTMTSIFWIRFPVWRSIAGIE